MILGYGDFTLTFGITSSASSSGVSTFLNDSSAMADGRTGTATSFNFDPSSASLSQFTEIIVNVTSPLDTTAPWGVVGICNMQGLPVGTRLTFNGVTQRLVYGRRRELCAWWIPNGITGASHGIFIYNDVNGVASITPNTTVAVGEIFVGRVMSLPSLSAGQPTSGRFDPTASTTTAGGQDWQLMRKMRRTIGQHKVGPFTTAQAKGGSASDLVSGANPAGTTDIESLIDILGESRVFAACDTPSAGRGDGTVVNGIRYDQDFMQPNWMLCRPSDIGQLAYDMNPYWSWTMGLKEAT